MNNTTYGLSPEKNRAASGWNKISKDIILKISQRSELAKSLKEQILKITKRTNTQ